jgi:hypothetical protein
VTAHVLVLLFSSLLAAPCADRHVPGQVKAAAQDADVLARFDARVAEYVVLHRRLEGPLPPQQMSDDMRVVQAAMDALATQLQGARAEARRGDLFDAEAARVFRRLIAGCLPADEMERIITEPEEEDVVPPPPLRVNGRWPAGVPFRFVPPQLLAALPRIPGELQYRIVGHSLVLWDHHADLVVDYLPDAFAAVRTGRVACASPGC